MQSIPKPHAPYFLIRSERQKEKESKEKIGSIFIAPSQTFMMYNTQNSEIIGIGERANKYFPEAEVGNTLLYHHFVQGVSENEASVEHLIHQDETYNYYVVTAFEYNGKNVEAYGIFDGEKIIPNKDYVFLEVAKPPVEDLPIDEMINQQLQKSESGLFLFQKWEETRENKERRIEFIKKQVQDLSRSGTHKEHIRKGIAEKEAEMAKLSAELNKSKYQPFTVAYANEQLSEWFDRPIGEGDVLGMLEAACATTITFMGTEYIVAKTKFIAYLYDKRIAA